MSIGAFTASSNETLVNTTKNGLQSDVTITALDGGGYVMCWTDLSLSAGDLSAGAIRAQRFDANGNKVGTEFLVNTVTANTQQQSSVASLAGGGFVVTWTDFSASGPDNDGQAVKAQRFDADGNKVGSEFTVNTTTRLGQNLPTVTRLSNDGFVISWTDGSGLAPDNRGTGVRAQVYDSAGVPVGGEFLVNTTTLNSQNYSSLAGLAGGGFVATWTDSSGQGGDTTASVKAQLFTSAGVKVGAEFLVNTATALAQDQPVVAALANGSFVIAWRDLSGVGDTSASGLKAQVYAANGTRIGTEFLVNTSELNTQDQPAITALPGGGFAIAWQDNSVLVGDTGGYGIKAQVFDNLGNRLGGEFQVNTVTAGNQLAPAITALASGELVIGWTDYSGTSGDLDGGIKVQQFAVNTLGISDVALSNSQVSEAAVEDTVIARIAGVGSINATYTYTILNDSTGGAFAIEGDKLKVRDSLLLDFEAATSATLLVRAADGFGNSFDKLLTLGIQDAVMEDRYAARDERLANTAIANNQQQPAAAALASGNYVIVWADSSAVGGDINGFGIKGQIVDALGQKIGPEFLINTEKTGNQDTPSVTALAGGGFFVSWTDASALGGDTSASGIKGQLFDDLGAAVGSEILVNTTVLNAQRAPSTAALSGGQFVVAWTDTSLTGGDTSVSGVRAQLFGVDGAKIGAEFLVNTQTGNRQEGAVATGLDTGGFVIAWADSSQVGGDSNKDAIKAQLYDAAGARIGGEFLVNTETHNNQQQASIASLSGGGFVVVWADASARGGDLENFGIKGQMFANDGSRIGAEFLVNTTTRGTQIQPKVTGLANGGFAVSWADYSGDGAEVGTAGIKAQLYSATGARIGGEVTVNDQTLGIQAVPTIAADASGKFLVGWTDFSGQGDDSGSGIKLRAFEPLGPQNPPPDLIAVADTLAGTEDLSSLFLQAELLANDTQAAGLSFSLISVEAVSGGTVSLDGNGDVVFAPLSNFSGAALFDYVIQDTAGATATGRVTVQVAGVNDAPTANQDAVNLSEDGGVITGVTLLANDIDIDSGDLLTIVGVSALTDGGVPVALANGNVALSPGSTLQYLRGGQTLVDSFSYTIADLAGITASALVTLTFIGSNDAPTALTLDGGAVDENSPFGTFVGIVTGLDPDAGDTLTYSLTNNAGNRFAIEASTGIISVGDGPLLDFETNPTHTIVARVTDEFGAFFERSFTVTVNDTPEPQSYVGTNSANNFTAPTNDMWVIQGLGGNDLLTGNASSDLIYGDAGNDSLNGAGGVDTLYGGIGDDTFFVDVTSDQVIEFFGEGNDIIFTTADYFMPANVERLTMQGTADLSATGNDFANTMIGNAGNNTFFGGLGGDLILGEGGNDIIFGQEGGDFLQGGLGDDRLIGSFGADELTGGAGLDVFYYDTLTVSADRDKIRDFVPGEDMVQLARSVFTGFDAVPAGVIPTSAFHNGVAATTADHRLIYQIATGNLWYDADGAGGAAQIQIALFSTRPVLTFASFETI